MSTLPGESGHTGDLLGVPAAVAPHIAALQTSLDELQETETTLHAEVSSLDENLETLQSAVTALERNDAMLHDNVNTLAGSLDGIHEGVNTLETSVRGLAARGRQRDAQTYNAQSMKEHGPLAPLHLICNHEGQNPPHSWPQLNHTAALTRLTDQQVEDYLHFYDLYGPLDTTPEERRLRLCRFNIGNLL
ncbi:hypothetical protein JCM1841_005992 [Sporobolomyces salmonicolor]